MHTHFYRFQHPIWRVIPGDTPSRFVVACRDASAKTSSLFGCSLEQSDLRISFNLPDPWWIQVYDRWENVLLIQGYADPGLPLPQGVYAYDGQHGQLLWAQPEVTVAGLTEEGIVVNHPHFQGRHSLLSALTGEVLRDQLLDAQPRMQAYQTKRHRHTHFPSVAVATHPLFEQHQQALAELLGQAPVHQIETMVVNHDTWLHAYITPSGQPPYEGYLIRQQAESYQLMAGPFHRKGLLLDSFFVEKSNLFFMAEANSLVVISLT